MRGQLFKLWDRIRSSFWFIPALMAAAAVALALVSATMDKPITQWLALHFGWTFTGAAEGASAVLGVIAGSMITIGGVVFSMTLVTLSLASSQLGPRLLRSFMRDTTTQLVLGTFIATFLYCLIVLRTIRHGEDTLFVPHLSVTLGVLLAVMSVGVFIYFIHHVSVSIQANEVAARIGSKLIEGIDSLFPSQAGQESPPPPVKLPDAAFFEAFAQEARPIGACGDGYLQFIDAETLLALAIEEDLIIQLQQRPGNFVIDSCPLALVWPGHKVTDKLIGQIQLLFVLGRQRTSGQDIEFEVNQLVEIAVRALSPGINDPFTAITCVDHLGSALCRLISRDIPSPYLHDHQYQLRVITAVDTFQGIVAAAFNQIRQYSRSSAAVSIRLLEVIAVVAGFAQRAEDRATLLLHADMIALGASEGLPEQQDRLAVEQRYQKIKASCGEQA
ncbi:DUF2254 domain-containing protein [Dasania marina]|uniref:DUF2254 domain-containing protein n=1 Tax=Dasania marina TaxID=471499 RepID=UPI0030DC69E2|tara:strand:+ start:13975 stop:15309 length:1335 start_codon:yes stop_codon:yes gene_type:complete